MGDMTSKGGKCYIADGWTGSILGYGARNSTGQSDALIYRAVGV